MSERIQHELPVHTRKDNFKVEEGNRHWLPLLVVVFRSVQGKYLVETASTQAKSGLTFAYGAFP